MCGSVRAYTRNAKSLCPRHHSAEPWNWRLTGAGLNCPSLRCRSAHQFRTLAPTVPVLPQRLFPVSCSGEAARLRCPRAGVVTARGLRSRWGVCRPKACFSVGLPLMFLWLPNNQFRRPGRASWQAVALCRGINRRL